jgi:hypothetical protein
VRKGGCADRQQECSDSDAQWSKAYHRFQPYNPARIQEVSWQISNTTS